MTNENLSKIQDKPGIDISLYDLPVAPALPVNESQTIEFIGFFAQKSDISQPAIMNYFRN
jgi:hypothetical protein